MKVGFMFGAGAEVGYGLPTGGDFALNIFRQDSSESKEAFRKQRAAIDPTSRYAQWLPDDYMVKNVSMFRKKAYEDIIRSTVEQNRDSIVAQLNNMDALAAQVVADLVKQGIQIEDDFLNVNEREVSNSFMNKTITFVTEFKDGNDIFKSNYFSALLLAYKALSKKGAKERNELGKVVTAILQLQIGALGEKLTKRINEGVFEKRDDDLDILEDLGDIIQLNYQSVGMSGLEYLLEIQKPDLNTESGRILLFAQKLIEKIYSCVLDYKTLIDSNWMYLYHPKNEWSKFCKIVIFLMNVQNYIKKIYEDCSEEKNGYYDDIAEAITSGRITVSALGTSNYTPLIQNILSGHAVTYLNGSTSLWYDPYLNRVGTEEEFANKEKHFLVPLMFTQSGTKPMISIDMSSKYVKYYEALMDADEICIIGFGFNADDEHINGLFRDLIDSKEKKLTIVTRNSGKSALVVKKELVTKLKVANESNISIILVDDDRKRNGVTWVDCLVAANSNPR